MIEGGPAGPEATNRACHTLDLVGALMLSRSVRSPDLSDRLLETAQRLLIQQANAHKCKSPLPRSPTALRPQRVRFMYQQRPNTRA
ncbi:hypothetical protein D3879_23380 [Pseudomonas cavernicola]|uniref:Uncharacterized protein n=1 Tax=Pseudomonas cavernicola TaxID=2320866 RepID=A0A418X8I8_9PSED|nr:hypothetical protein D3879_23380 [Pseudomonas cavernicola]